MSEKVKFTEANTPRKERFEIDLTINGNLVCQRYFRIFGFKSQSLSSVELTEAFDRAVALIDEDLMSKSRAYLRYTAPQVYANKEEMCNHLEGRTVENAHLEAPSFIVLKDTREVFLWNGKTANPYNNYFNVADYVSDMDENTPCVLALTLYDNGFDLSGHKEVMTRAWDGNVYPRFIRNNIDLTNKYNKFKDEDVYAPYEAALVDILNAGRKDLTPIIVKEFFDCCSCDEGEKPNYTQTVKYGDTLYRLDIKYQNELYEKSVERMYQKKTDQYFRSK